MAKVFLKAELTNWKSGSACLYCLFTLVIWLFILVVLIKLKTTHEFVESQAAKAVVGQTIY